jgi:tRNA(Arg) A34 adenosine deaminase TadA
MNDGAEFVSRLLDVIENHIVPLTRAGVAVGNKVFGAAILRKADLSVVIAETNNETENPLWHGEVHALKKFYELPKVERPATGDCVFLATHEPCSLCLSAITWTGFDNFHYLFGYADTENTFNIPHDLRILREVFKLRDGGYARQNQYWSSHGIPDLITAIPEPAKTALTARCAALDASYRDLSDSYARVKDKSDIPLS